MELKINLATARLKDAEHAIFLIGAYFGLTQSTIGDVRITAPVAANFTSDPKAAGPVLAPQGGSGPVVLPLALMPQSPVAANAAAHLSAHEDAASTGNDGPTDPAATFGATPPVLPAAAGESPLTPDPAAVFAGNALPPGVFQELAAAGPAGLPVSPAAAPSATPVAAPAAGDAGNGVPTAPAPVGTPPVLPPAPVASAVELDKEGLPWDARINASGEGGKKPQNADGTWRKKRGLNDAAYINGVKAELRATMAAGQGVTTATPPVPLPPVAAVVQATVMPVVAPPAPGAAPLLPQPQADPVTFEQLMPRVTNAVVAGKVPGNALLAAVQAYALPTVISLQQRPDLVPNVWAYLVSQYPALAV